MICAGETLRRTTHGPIDVPQADVEIDFDIEWDTSNHVYLWGALLRAPGRAAEYHPIVNSVTAGRRSRDGPGNRVHHLAESSDPRGP